MLTHPKNVEPARMILPGIEPGCPLPSGETPEPNVRGLQFFDLQG